MFDFLFKNCAICNTKHLKSSMMQKKNTDSFICNTCLNLFFNYNGYISNYINNYKIEEIKKSIYNKKSLRDLDFEQKYKEHKKKQHEMKELNNDVYKNCYKNLKYISPTIFKHKESKNILKYLPDFKFSNITSKTSLNTINTFVVIDTETTGLRPSSDELLEISAIKFINGEPKECLTTLLKPQKKISQEIESINHITNAMIQNSPTVGYIIKNFSNFIDGFNIVGYNLEFDIKFLYRNGMDLFTKKRKFYDVLPLCKQKFKDDSLANYKLDTICSHLGITRSNEHRATEDALATGILFRDIGQSKKVH